MTQLLIELKTRARLQLNAARRQDAPDAEGPGPRLRHCLNQVARDVGFAHWDDARRVLGGQAASGDDMGAFWYAPRCATLLNLWFAGYEPARAAQEADRGAFLLPYRRQFIVAQDDFVRELGMDPADPAWAVAQRDLVRAYGSRAWLDLAFARMKAPRSTFA